jgi:hypothetical protein
VHLELLADALGKNCARDFDSKILFVLSCFFSSTVNHSTTVRHHSVAYRADLLCDIVDSLVSSGDQHLVLDNLLSAENNSVFANDSDDCATVRVS